MFNNLLKKIGMDGAGSSIPKLSPGVANEKVSNGDLILVDVREPNEWQVDGNPEGCIQIALQNENFANEVLLSVNNDKNKKVALCCRSGMRGEKAGKILLKAGFCDVVNVEGGILRWLKEGLPTVKSV